MFCNFIITIKSWQDSKAWFVPHNYERKDFRCRVEKHSFSSAKKQPLGPTTLMSPPLLKKLFSSDDRLFAACHFGTTARLRENVWSCLDGPLSRLFQNPHTFVVIVYCCETRFFFKQRRVVPFSFRNWQTLIKVLLTACYFPKFTISSY